MAFWQWSKTPTSNGTSDPTMNWSEGIAPSIVDDNVRALMARAAEFRDDTSGLLVTAGTSTAYTLTTNQVLPSTPNDGQLIVFAPHTANGSSATLQADGGTAFPLQSSPGTALASGAFTANIPYQFKFRNASSAWILFGAGNAAVAAVANAVAAGSVTNAGLANMAAWTIKMNNTSGSAPPTDTTIDALTVKASPLVADEVPIWDAAGASMKKATFAALAALILAQGAAPTVQRFTTGTAATYTPSAGIARIKVRMMAGGGGGGAASTNNGQSGSNSSFGSWTVVGGAGGVANAGGAASGGSGGANGTGTLVDRISGTNGPSGGQGLTGAVGASGPRGGGGAPTENGAGGNATANTGAGGAGGGNTAGNNTGGGGAEGEYAEFWMTAAQVGASQTYTVGPGGSGGLAGGQAGGNGAAGIIIVEEFYI